MVSQINGNILTFLSLMVYRNLKKYIYELWPYMELLTKYLFCAGTRKSS